MGQKDLTTKALQSFNDVFADIFNVLLFDKNDEVKIDSRFLEDMPTESIYIDADGNLRNMFQDSAKIYKANTPFPLILASFGLENQSQIDKPMPIRVMGYQYTAYKKQLDEYEYTKRAYQKGIKFAENDSERNTFQRKLDELGEFKLVPSIILVLNYGKKKWEQPKSLKDLVTEDNPYANFLADYKIKVVDVLYLEKETLELFTSDYKSVVKVLVNGETVLDDTILSHPVEVYRMIKSYVEDKQFESISDRIEQKAKRGEAMSLKTFLDEMHKQDAIKVAKAAMDNNASNEIVIAVVKAQLGISDEEASHFVETEILNTKIA